MTTKLDNTETHVDVSLFKGTGKNSGNPFEAIKLEVGEWSTLVFPKSEFEMKHIKAVLRKRAELNLDEE